MDICLVLHAHLPWVRDPVHRSSIEERWLFEALWETYLPLLEVLDAAAARDQHQVLALSLSPPLLAMLADERLRAGFLEHLEAVEEIATREIARAGAGLRADALGDHLTRLRRGRARLEVAGGDVARAFGDHHRAGTIELFTTAATHPLLPACNSPGHVAAQLSVARHMVHATTGVDPVGLWLPECAYDPRLDDALQAAGVGWSVLDAHGIENGRPRSPLGVYAPAMTPHGLAVLAREPGAARRVWSRREGYPGDPAYREHHRDLVDELPPAALGRLAPPPGARSPVGLRPWRVTGSETKEPYDPRAAAAQVRAHALDFIAAAARSLAAAPRTADAPPCLVAPYDAELFGHWWWEGPAFLDAVLATLHRGGPLRVVTPSDRLARHPMAPVIAPAISTWGEGGHSDVWAATDTAPMLRAIHRAERDVDTAFAHLAHAAHATSVHALRVRDLAARELMLGAASDWAFLVRTGTNIPYAQRRAAEHLARSMELSRIARSGAAAGGGAARVAAIEDDGPPLAWFPRELLEAAWR